MTCGKAQSHFGWIQPPNSIGRKWIDARAALRRHFPSPQWLSMESLAKFPDDSSVHRTSSTVGTEWCFRWYLGSAGWRVWGTRWCELAVAVQMQQWLKLDLEIKSVQIQLTVPNQVQKKPVEADGVHCGCWSECTRYQAARKTLSAVIVEPKAKGTGTTSGG